MSRRMVYECDACGCEMEDSQHDRYELWLGKVHTPDDEACNRHLDLCGLCSGCLRQGLADRIAAHHHARRSRRERPS